MYDGLPRLSNRGLAVPFDLPRRLPAARGLLRLTYRLPLPARLSLTRTGRVRLLSRLTCRLRRRARPIRLLALIELNAGLCALQILLRHLVEMSL